MARHPNPRTPVAHYRGITIRLYRRKDGWKSTFKFPGHPRRECYGPTRPDAEEAAAKLIAKELNPHVMAALDDEMRARSLLEDHGISLTEAARDWLAKNKKPHKKATVKEVRSLFLAMHQTSGFHHLRSLQERTQHLEETFAERQIGTITKAELIDWQNSLKVHGYSGRTVRNIHDATKQLFKFARDTEHLDPDRLSNMELVKRPTANPAPKHVYTPEQMQKLLDAAWAIASPAAVAMAISAFTAIRTEEIFSVDPKRLPERQLAWEDFRWKEKFIYVRAEVAKLKTARPVPLPVNLRKMLEPLKGTGLIYKEKRIDLEYAKIAQKAGIDWKSNAPRHSSITYRMLLTAAPAEVANWAGNSVQTIESNYRNKGAVKSQALAWFKLAPKTAWGSCL